jgi:prophage regulatory protein
MYIAPLTGAHYSSANYAPASRCTMQHYDGELSLAVPYLCDAARCQLAHLGTAYLVRGHSTADYRGRIYRTEKEVSMNPNPDRIVRLKTVIFRSGISRSTIYRKMKDGTFPAQIKVNINGIGWHESELNRWIANPPAYRAPDLQQ